MINNFATFVGWIVIFAFIFGQLGGYFKIYFTFEKKDFKRWLEWETLKLSEEPVGLGGAKPPPPHKAD